MVRKIAFIIGGRMGDFIHLLHVVKYMGKTEDSKTVLITNDTKHGGDTFQFPIDRVYQDLEPILKELSYVQEFRFLEEATLSDYHAVINLNTFRHSPYLMKTNWCSLLSSTFSIPLSYDPWLTITRVPLKIKTLCNSILVHRSLHRHNDSFPWKSILERNQETPIYFITSSYEEYEHFPWKHLVNGGVFVFDHLYDLVASINQSKFFIGNQSSPMAYCIGLGKPCLIELANSDAIMYCDNDYCNSQAFYYFNNRIKKLTGIETHIRTFES